MQTEKNESEFDEQVYDEQIYDEQIYLENLQIIKQLCLMDDIFMSQCFDNDIECAQLVLRIILDKPDLQVIEAHSQVVVANLLNRSVRLDVLAVDSAGKRYNIEVQRSDKGAAPQRARFNSSLLDAKFTEKGTDFADLPETYVIFITENDVFGLAEPLYEIERCILKTGAIFGDGAHIIYVNGAYRDDTPIGRLMHDFACPEPDKMFYNELADKTRFYKEEKEGNLNMSGILEEYWSKREKDTMKKGIEKGKELGKNESQKEIIQRMLAAGKYTLEDIVDITGLSLEEVKKLQSDKSV